MKIKIKNEIDRNDGRDAKANETKAEYKNLRDE